MRVGLHSAGVLVVTLSVVGCGGGGGGGGIDDNGSGMSRAEAEGLAKQLSAVSAGAAGGAQGAVGGGALGAAARSPEPDSAVQCTPDYSSCTYNIDTSYTNNCTAGGTIHATGNFSGTMSSSGTGMFQLQITETLTDWQCIPGYVIEGDPYISLTGTFSYVNGNPGTNQSLTMSGGFKWNGGSCQIRLTTLLNSSGGWTTTGSVCGYPVAVSST